MGHGQQKGLKHSWCTTPIGSKTQHQSAFGNCTFTKAPKNGYCQDSYLPPRPIGCQNFNSRGCLGVELCRHHQCGWGSREKTGNGFEDKNTATLCNVGFQTCLTEGIFTSQTFMPQSRRVWRERSTGSDRNAR